MPTYTIQLKDGRKVKVQADSPNAALAEANRFAASNPRKKPNYVIPKRVKVAGVDVNLTDANDAQRLATQGFAFGQAPRVMGAFGAVMGVPDAIRQGKLDPIAEAYNQNRKAEIAAIDAARARSGLVGTGIEIAGGLVTGGTIAKAGGQALTRVAPKAAPRVAAALAPRSGSVGGKVARFSGRTAVAAGGGAIAGGLYGSGEGRAVENALYGAAGGAAAEPIARGAGALVRGGRRLLRKPKVKPEVKAARVFLDPLSGRIDLAKAQAQIDEANRLGLELPSLVDVVNNSGRRLVRGVAGNTTDDAQQMAVDYATRTREALPDRGLGIVRRLTGGEVDLPAMQNAAEANVRNVDLANYPPLMNQQVSVTPDLLNALTSQRARGAIGSAIDIADTAGRKQDVAALAQFNQALQSGNMDDVLNTPITASALEDIYRALRDTSRGMMQSTGEQAATRSVGRALGDVTQTYDTALQAISPGIRQARAASREARQGAEALDVGYNAFAPSRLPDALAGDVAALPQSARPNVLAGAQARLQQQIGENPFAAVNSLGFRPNMGARLNAMGAPADDMVAAAQMEARRVRNADFISPNTGSQTQLRATDIPEMGAIPTTPMGWANKLMDFAFRRINAFTDAELEAIVRMGIEPADLQALQALAAREPDKIPSVIKGLIGTAGGIGISGQVNAGTSQGYQQ